MKLFHKAKFFYGLWRTGKNGWLSHTHRGPKVVLTAFESFKSKNLKQPNRFGISMLWGFSQSFQNSNRRPTAEVIAKNVKICLCRSVLNHFAGRVQADGRTHRHHNRLCFLHRSAFKGCLIWHMTVRRETQKRQWEKGLRGQNWSEKTVRTKKRFAGAIVNFLLEVYELL